MIRLDHFVLGYVVFHIDGEHVRCAAERLLRGGKGVRFASDGSFRTLAWERERVCALLGDIPYTVSPIRGLFGAIASLRKRYGVLLAMLAFVIMLVFSSDTVWDVRLEGCPEGDEEAVLADLGAAGLSVGRRWSKIERSEVEVQLLSSSEEVAWISINRRGTVAYVTVVPKEAYPEPPTREGYANVVASFDGVVEEITVRSGIALVKPGETVRAGQVLILGVIPTEQGGGYCYAEGRIIARRTDRITVNIPPLTEQRVYEEGERKDFSINFFGNDINILKIYGNSAEGCDIIEKKHTLTLFGRTLPISYTVKTLRPYKTETRELSADEATRLAAEALQDALRERLAECELVSVHTEGGFAEDGYRMTADIVLCENIAQERKFEFITE